ncbi:MAG TPA: SET domain-containing protein [Candidatus Peribacterales bacterium]|nr:SET domain-containing protein [Candidatus Peribacterales bacterium]
MLQIATYIGPSVIHGIGLFAQKPISKGTVVWEFVEGIDHYLSDETMATLPQTAVDFIHFYFYRSKLTGQYVLLGDNDRFTNHSYHPNVGGPTSLFPHREGGIALRDISPGEELTSDYSSFDADFYHYADLYPRERAKIPVRVLRHKQTRHIHS